MISACGSLIWSKDAKEAGDDAMLRVAPAVFAVGNDYQILIPVKRSCLMWVKVGDETYYDACNGVLCTLCRVHRVQIPMQALDAAKSYTVCWKRVLKRKPYFTETAETQEKTFSFHPVPDVGARAYHIADAHNLLKEPIRAAKAFGNIDFLILNGDLLDYTSCPRKYDNIYKLCDALTGGEIPVVFARGNHDMRGKFAEKFTDFAPNDAGRTYYTFRLGSIWGVVLDCGEDKADDCAEYGNTIACHPFRVEETAFLRQVVAKGEFDVPEIHTRLIISHIPFTQTDVPPFDIEQQTYGEWTDLLRRIEPHLMICGHTHVAQLRMPGCDADHLGQPCPVVIASGFDDKSYWTGCGFTFAKEKTQLVFTDSNGKTIATKVL